MAEPPDWTEQDKREEDAARQTRSLAAVAVLLLLLVAALGLTHILRRSAAVEDCMMAAQLLLDRGVDVNRVYAHNLTALMWAAGYGRSDCVRLLLDRGADPRPRDDRGKTARDIAQEQGFQETAVLLPGGA